jgi:hypothetical protein
MTKKEYYSKLAILFVIVLLFLADVGMGINLITKPFRS